MGGDVTEPFFSINVEKLCTTNNFGVESDQCVISAIMRENSNIIVNS